MPGLKLPKLKSIPFKRHSTALALIILALHVLIALQFSQRFGWDASGFLVIGDYFANSQVIPQNLIVRPKSYGYDGQFFFMIAQDPFITREVFKSIDNPPYRYQRILYPLLSFLLAAGHTSLLPFTLIIVNLLGIYLAAIFAIRILQRGGLHPVYVIFFGLSGGFLICLFRDLSGITAMAFLMGGLFFYLDHKLPLAAMFLALSTLGQELLIPIIFVLGVWPLLFHRDYRSAIWMFVSSLPFLAWEGYIYHTFEAFPWHGGVQNLGFPGQGLWHYGQKLLLDTPAALAEQVFFVLSLIVIVTSLFYAIVFFLRENTALHWCFLGFAIFPFILTDKIWVEPWSYGRVLLPLYVLLFVVFATSKRRALLFPLGAHLLLFPVTLWWVQIV